MWNTAETARGCRLSVCTLTGSKGVGSIPGLRQHSGEDLKLHAFYPLT